MIRAGRVAVEANVWVCSKCRAFATASRQRVLKDPERRERRPPQKLPTSPARTRFAPSPTGYLHLGSLRTALFNFLLAKATGGQFLLRLEDTDQKRTVDDAEKRLYKDLKWAGLYWDEGPDIGGPFGPYKQSKRTLVYQEHADKLLHSGHAYRCFCSSERTNPQPRTTGEHCSAIPMDQSDERYAKEPHVIRLRIPNVSPPYTDLVYGAVGNRGRQEPPEAPKWAPGRPCFEDLVLIKSDGFPTYHLANVVDDHKMEVTHVIRAVEWMSSTPKHIVMYEAFDWEPPMYAHVGLLQNSERQKYSKRKGDANLDMRSLEMKGVFPEALVNYVALHGWSHDLGDDLLRLTDLIHNFDLKFTKGNTVIVPTKLDYLQKRYAEKYAKEGGPRFDEMVERTSAVVELVPDRALICPAEDVHSRIAKLLHLEARKYTSPQEFFNLTSYFFYPESRPDGYRQRIERLVLDNLSEIETSLTRIPVKNWNTTALGHVIKELNELLGNLGAAESAENSHSGKTTKSALQSFLRWAISFGRPGPTIVETMEILGREVTLERLEDAIAYLQDPIKDHGIPTP